MIISEGLIESQIKLLGEIRKIIEKLDEEGIKEVELNFKIGREGKEWRIYASEKPNVSI